jgi:hypothetical protein
MFDTSLFRTEITGDTAVIRLELLGGLATVLTLANRATEIVGYVSHEQGQEPIDWIQVTVSGTDINTIVDQAIVVLSED